MTPPTFPAPNGLRWVQPRTKPGNPELHDADAQIVGTFRFLPKPSITWGFTDRRAARGEVGASHWDLSVQRTGIAGLFGASATVLIDGGKTGTLEGGAFFATGTLSLASGRRMTWKGSVLEGMPCAFVDENGELLVRIDGGSILTRTNGAVDVQPQAADMSEWPLLVVLALYLRLLMNRVFW